MSFETRFEDAPEASTFEEVLSWGKVNAKSWESLVAHMGEPGLTDFTVVAAIADEEWRDAIKELGIGVTTDKYLILRSAEFVHNSLDMIPVGLDLLFTITTVRAVAAYQQKSPNNTGGTAN